MAPDWEKLMDNTAAGQYDPSAFIGDVDCTADEGKKLCAEHDVKSFPTLLWGDPSDLQKYEGGREYDDLETFVKENLKPLCGVNNIDLCEPGKKAEFEEAIAMSTSDLQAAIARIETANDNAENAFKTAVEGLQKQYEIAMRKHEEVLNEVTEGRLGLMKAVMDHKKAGGADFAASENEL
jgi:hypothetical protein